MMKSFQTMAYLLITLSLSGCHNQNLHDDLNVYFEQAKNTSSKFIKKEFVVEPYKPFIYSASDIKDPFEFLESVPQKVVKKIGNVKPDLSRKKQFLEKFELDLFEFVGTFQKQEELLEGLVNVEGKLYTMSVGDYLGVNHGRIVSVTDQNIQIVEIVPVTDNTWIEKKQVLSLQKSR